MYKKLRETLILVFLCQLGFGQTLLEIKASADFIEVDNMENVYVIKGSELKKYSPSGVFLFSYSNKINGVITCVDATNPLRIILFYKESNAVAFLNQQLSLISDPVDIYEAENIEALAAGGSSGGSFWAFSVDRQSLILFNSKLEKAQESQNLSGWIKGENIEFIRERNQKVYVGLAEKVLVFDMFGFYLTTIHFENGKYLKMVGDQISYFTNERIWLYNPSLKNEIEVANSTQAGQKFIFAYKNRIYSVQEKSILIYKNN